MTPPLTVEAARCPRCGAGESRRIHEGRDHLHETPGVFVAAECRSCGLWFQNPRPHPSEIGRAYPLAYAPHDATQTIDPPLQPRTMGFLVERLGYPGVPLPPRAAPAVWQKWRATVDLIPHFVREGALLEIGAAAGGRLRMLRALGWSRLTGIEMVASAAEVARRSGFVVHSGPVESVIDSLPDAAVDVVVASFVLEHLYDPFAIVRQVARILRPGGEFLFSTITRDSLDAAVWGRYWSGFDFPRHMVYFNTGDLRRMAQDDFEWIASARHAATQDFTRPAWWRLMDKRNLTDRVVGRFCRQRALADLAVSLLAWLGATSRISVRCRRR
jgi:2-polyprenyl-3-methyl-5-hydroxy-6-metoxy-1,4-benzoquinol methylase